MSTLEAEYIACSEGAPTTNWLIQFHRDIHGNDTSPLLIKSDNQGALTHTTTGTIKAHRQHIDVSYHNSRDLHSCKIVEYPHLHTNRNLPDILTKAFTQDKHKKFTKVMGLSVFSPVRGWTSLDWTGPGLVQYGPRIFRTGIGPV